MRQWNAFPMSAVTVLSQDTFQSRLSVKDTETIEASYKHVLHLCLYTFLPVGQTWSRAVFTSLPSRHLDLSVCPCLSRSLLRNCIWQLLHSFRADQTDMKSVHYYVIVTFLASHQTWQYNFQFEHCVYAIVQKLYIAMLHTFST